ncbi:MAG: isoleucine--tRNA ligase [Ruminococcus flavefaciens]|nr:isoleucine--tRNA ligase [Ruminococcus flavefaciens]MCM1360588.1 isoleucine--tRNA ligase [Clostridiales bacterium]MCM1435228.1 isoleucine--tRNA ligase [Ruminococcus flavefaciens]
MAQDYNNTLNLPKTDFPMRGNLPKREPETLEKWEKERLYYKMIEKNKGKKTYILHDGPPYANGEIHLGTALNKTLKDFIVKYKNMSGFCAPYVPGWDTHGLPIELKAMKSIGVENGAIPPVELRKHCHDFAMMHVQNQMKQFKRLGTIGDYDYPYLTLRPEFEARQVEVFGEMAKRGYMYKGLKPVYWCPDCNTALAEAEIEYSNDPCYSIYVKFNVTDDKGIFSGMGLDTSKIYFVIWTTTTWTIPGNLAICLGPEYNYTLVHVGDEYYVMAEELVKTTMETAGITEYTTEGIFTGAELEGMKTKHPLYDRPSPIIVGDHVTLESGTGCVHTAPGYGVEDFEVCKNYDDIGIIVCVDAKGRQTAEAGEFEGMDTDTANKAIAAKLTEVGAMLATQKIVHQYPHCWRCNSPIIYRATEQWFCSVNDFKDEAIKAIEEVQWIPEWGEDRIKGMVRDRSDWCISRQRTWGVPIPIVYCKDCGKPIVNDETISAIADLFRKEGSDAWWTREASEFIPASVKCECGCSEFTKEYDIMDVWFDSGVSHTAVMDEFDSLSWPADLYLEGADQYRGWFQSSLLTSVVYKGTAPYKAVCTHGWVVDGEGKTMHKSLGNGIDPSEITDQYGADILRLWVASSDYHSDIRISKTILSQLSDAYKKIRNTARFILGNLGNGNGFNPDTDSVSDDKLTELDKWALMRLDALIDKVNEGYQAFDFHIAFHAIHNFCVIDMSNFYLDIIKDRLYCEKEDSELRRAAQTAMYRILSAVARLAAPIISFTAEEIWQFMPHTSADDTESVFLNQMPEKSGIEFSEAFIEKWNFIYAARESANKALEDARNEKIIGKSLEAKIIIKSNEADFGRYSDLAKQLTEILIVSDVEIEKNDGETVFEVAKAEGGKCERCWCYSKYVGENHEHPTLCQRCAIAIEV